MRKALVALFLLTVVCAGASASDIWVKGNVHSHTNRSDGDAPPEVVAKWYKDHGYSFLVITDHAFHAEVRPDINIVPSGRVTGPEDCASVVSDQFIVIPGVEITHHLPGPCIHVCALGVRQVLEPYGTNDPVEMFQKEVDRTLAAGGVPVVCHPNYKWALNYDILSKCRDYSLIEIFNHGPNLGDRDHTSVEELWDSLLSDGRTIYGLAVDDGHRVSPILRTRQDTGRGWIWVRVDRLTEQEVLDNITRGNFYASTGVELADYSFDGRSIRISVKPVASRHCQIQFVGRFGQVLTTVDGTEATYRIRGKPEEAYVRAKVTRTDGAVAWTQPVRLAR